MRKKKMPLAYGLGLDEESAPGGWMVGCVHSSDQPSPRQVPPSDCRFRSVTRPGYRREPSC